MLNLKNEELDEVINNNEKILILFSAEWCGPCKVIKPNLEKIEDQFNEIYKFVKIDIAEDKNNAEKFNIKNVPTVILLKDKKEKGRFIGARSTDQIKKFLEEYID